MNELISTYGVINFLIMSFMITYLMSALGQYALSRRSDYSGVLKVTLGYRVIINGMLVVLSCALVSVSDSMLSESIDASYGSIIIMTACMVIMILSSKYYEEKDRTELARRIAQC